MGEHFKQQWPSQEGKDRSKHLAVKAIWSPPLSQTAQQLSYEDTEAISTSLKFNLEQAVNSAITTVLGVEQIPRLKVEEELVGPAVEGLISEYFVTIWERREELTDVLSGLADAYAIAELVGRIKQWMERWQLDPYVQPPTIELSFTPEALLACCIAHVKSAYRPRATLSGHWEVLEDSGDFDHPSERLQYQIAVTAGRRVYLYRVDATGQVHDHRVLERLHATVLPVPQIIPDVSTVPVRMRQLHDYATGEVRRGWPTQDGTDRSGHFAIIAVLSLDLGRPPSTDLIDISYSLNDEVRHQLELAVNDAAREMLQSEDIPYWPAEHYQVGPAADALTQHFIVTLWEHREGLAGILSVLGSIHGAVALVSFVSKHLKNWAASLRDPRIDVSLSYPPEVLTRLCKRHVRANYHPRAKLKTNWSVLTQEFYGGYVSPAHPSGALEYLITVASSRRVYSYRIDGEARVRTHSCKEGRRVLPLPIPDVLAEVPSHSYKRHDRDPVDQQEQAQVNPSPMFGEASQGNDQMVKPPEPHVIVDAPCETGEGPLWHEDEGVLYWVDIPAGRVYRYDPASGRNEVAFQHDAMVGGFTIQDDGALLLFCSRGAVLLLRDGAVETVIAEIPAERDGRFNDVITDPEGRVYCGTMPSPKGLARLYRLDPDGSLTELFGDIGLSNGMGFSPDLTTFYHTDTNHRCIYRLDYDRATGDVANRAVLLRTPPDEGAPDGMAVAVDGTIWSARWNGSALFHYDAAGELLGSVPFPVRKVSSVTFGGADYATAYVTTACGEGGSRGAEEGQQAGSLYRVDLGVRGRPPFRSRIGL